MTTPLTLDLNGRWELAGFDGYGQTLGDTALPAGLPNLLWIDAEVPGSVHRDLMRAGWLPELYADCHTLAARWVEDDYWFYRRRFDVPEPPGDRRAYLVLEGLDLDAVVYLNGAVVGEHHNVFRPLRIDVTGRLRPRDNELIVRLDSGKLLASDRRGGDYNLELTAAATKRAWLRKPQYGCRWDWSPRLMNVGLGGGVRLELCATARLDAVVVTPELSGDRSRGAFRVRALVENVTGRARPLTLRVRRTDDGPEIQTTAVMPPGAGELRATLPVESPQLWWPRGHGAPHLYELEIELRADATSLAVVRRTTGLRRVEVRQPPAADGGTLLHLVVNDEPVFCKGANWVPADLLYPTVTPADYEQLVGLAVECGCNLLRVWGGGHYATPDFLAACDRAGVLVWHDLIFACSKYPGDDPAFVSEVEAEVRHQVRALAHHPSLAVWCGNNEVDLGIHDGWITSYDPATRPCHDLFHRRFAELMRAEDGSRPYWPTSPWSPDGRPPNDPASGDQHPWTVSLGAAKGDYWHYRTDASRFPNEGGMLGPSTPKTLRAMLPEPERRVGSRTWLHHDNSQNTWRGEPLLDHLLRLNLGVRPQALSFDDYVHYAGILHGEALETAIDNWHRRKWDSASAVFWMFNDTWPATTSWTPIDYYRRRKPAFWYVKRAFADRRAIAVGLERELAVFVVNDLRTPQRFTLRWGLFALAGGRPVDETVTVECPANAAVVAARRPLADWDRLGVATHGAFAVLSDERGTLLSMQRLFRRRFGELAWAPADVCIERLRGQGPGGPTGADLLRLTCPTFAWAVTLDVDGERPLADNWFDLLPGVPHTLPWAGDWPTPTPRAANPPDGWPGRA